MTTTTRLVSLRTLLDRVHRTADICIARSTDPKDAAEHESWRKSKAAELEAEIAELERSTTPCAHCKRPIDSMRYAAHLKFCAPTPETETERAARENAQGEAQAAAAMSDPTPYEKRIAREDYRRHGMRPLELLEAVLLFHSSSPWTDAKAKEWARLVGPGAATTKALCDVIRKVLADNGREVR